MQKHYKKAPITEAIIDLRVYQPGDLPLDKLMEIYPLVEDKLPTLEPFYQGTGTILFQPGSPIETNLQQRQLGYWFRSEDKLQTLQVSPQGFTLNQLAPYDSWEKFSNEAKLLWGIYKEICRPTHVTRVGLRYTNQINIPADDTIELKDFLLTVPEVSPKLTHKTLQNFFMQLQIPQQDLDSMLIINEAIVPPTSTEFITVILDVDLYRQHTWDSTDEDIWQFLEKARVRKNEAFEASISDKTRELIC